MRTFTISPSTGAAATEPVYSIHATYSTPERSRRYGSLEVCTGWTRDRIVQKFLTIDRADTAFLLAQQLGCGEAIHVSMQPDELIRWNN